ncbi:hypothetical protein JD844_027779 [Phrynosoma platyrhinos]|uniref:Inhibitor of growth protein n=1 Tax=Phrynosoma platyrhinos TaxID=52577 RepID=A0ABQ7SGY3_PHRPL|nr:hypothetical protein JD844_027779 [Phrynosoma platyrhinos]
MNRLRVLPSLPGNYISQKAAGGRERVARLRQKPREPIAWRPERALSAANVVFPESSGGCCWRCRRHIGRDEAVLCFFFYPTPPKLPTSLASETNRGTSKPRASLPPPPCCTWRTTSKVMIEQLPMDLRDRFTEMREMDLQVQNAMDQLEQRVNEFFMNAKKNKQDWREEQMTSIKKVDRHLRKLDQELAKFKMELEADNAGITEILERRSLELDTPSQPLNNHHAHSHTPVEKRKHNPSSHHSATDHVPEKKFKSEALLSTLTSDASKENAPGCRNSNSSSSSNSAYNANSSQPLASYNLGSLSSGAGAGAITMAAAQAVQATAQVRNSNYGNLIHKDACEGETLYIYLFFRSNNKSSSQQSSSSSSSSSLSSCSSSSALAQELSQQAAVIPESESNSQVDWTYDPNEPRYCICNQVSYGEMVGCDNQDCPIEWFHYGCVGLTEAPKGKWYCPQCTAAMKRRGNRHK